MDEGACDSSRINSLAEDKAFHGSAGLHVARRKWAGFISQGRAGRLRLVLCVMLVMRSHCSGVAILRLQGTESPLIVTTSCCSKSTSRLPRLGVVGAKKVYIIKIMYKYN